MAGQRRPAQVDDEQVDGLRLEQRRGHRQPLVEMVGAEHHEPLEVDAPRDRLDRVERPGRVEVGDHRPAGLRFGAEPQGEGRLAARDVALQRRRGRARQAAGPQDRIESGEARRHHRIEWRRRNVARPVDQARPAPA
jgi:hypothetical protein